MRQVFLPALLAAPLLLGAMVSGCSLVDAPKQLRGNRVDVDQIKELVTGTSTRADATSLLGSPTAKATFDDNTWIYIGEVTRTRVGRAPGVLQQDVVVLNFDQGGVLRGVKRLNQDDGRSVSAGPRRRRAARRRSCSSCWATWASSMPAAALAAARRRAAAGRATAGCDVVLGRWAPSVKSGSSRAG